MLHNDLRQQFKGFRDDFVRAADARLPDQRMFMGQQHSSSIREIRECIENDNPPSISLPGDKDSFLQVNVPNFTVDNHFTLALWIKLETNEKTSSTRGFLLFRCRSTSGGIDVILSDKNSDSEWTITVRTFRESMGQTKKEEIKGKVCGKKP